MALQKAHEVMQLEIGKMYLVAHAVCEIENVVRIGFGVVENRMVKQSVPIIPLLHKDAQFGVDIMHYHIDGRFNFKQHPAFGSWGEQLNSIGKTNNIVVAEQRDPEYGYVFKEVIYLKKRCVRLSTGLIINMDDNKLTRNGQAWLAWYKSMIGKTCAGKRCPHLGTKMIAKDDKLFCPLHNLVGCATTEKIIDNPNRKLIL